jgi:hypothetical protein
MLLAGTCSAAWSVQERSFYPYLLVFLAFLLVSTTVIRYALPLPVKPAAKFRALDCGVLISIGVVCFWMLTRG